MELGTIAALGGRKPVTIGGQAFLLCPLTPNDFAEMGHYLRGIAKARKKSPLLALADEIKQLPQELREDALRVAASLSISGEPTRDEIAAAANDLPGLQYQWYLATRATGGTLEQARQAVTDETQFDAIAALLEVNGQSAGNTDPK